MRLYLPYSGFALLFILSACSDRTLPVEPELDPEYLLTAATAYGTLFGPRVFTRSEGKPITEVVPVTSEGFDQFQPPFLLHVRNGSPYGHSRVTSASIALDGRMLLGPRDFSLDTSDRVVPVDVQPGSVLAVTLKSEVGSFLTLWIEGAFKPVTSIRLEPSEVQLSLGASAQLRATLFSADGTELLGRSVTWASSAPQVAMVDSDGLVTALATGQAMVSATAEGVSASTTVTVTSPLTILGGEIYGAHVDEEGNVLVGGIFESTLELGETTLTSRGGLDTFFAKFTATGDLIWVTQLGSVAEDRVFETDLGPDGSLYGGGFLRSAAVVSGGAGEVPMPYTGGSDGFLVKLLPTGQVDWWVTVGGGANDIVGGLKADPSGNVFAVGAFNGCCPSYGSALVRSSTGASLSLTTPSYQSGYLIKISPTGAPIWAVRGWNRDLGIGEVDVDANGHILVGGNFRSWSSGVPATFVDAGGAQFTLSNPGIGLGFLMKLSPEGHHLWSVPIGNKGDGPNPATVISDVRGLSTGGIALAGFYWNGGAVLYSTAGESISLPVAGGRDAFLASYDGEGRPVWGNRIGRSGESVITSLVEAPSGQLYCGGWFDGTIDFVGSMTSAGAQDMVFGVFDPVGGLIESQRVGAGGADAMYTLTLAPRGSILWGGVVSEGASFGSVTASQSGGFFYLR